MIDELVQVILLYVFVGSFAIAFVYSGPSVVNDKPVVEHSQELLRAGVVLDQSTTPSLTTVPRHLR